MEKKLSNIFSKGKTGMIPRSIRKAYNKTRLDEANTKFICSVPFTMMYFGFVGKVIGCCHTRDFYVGSYPEQSIKDIWTGQEMKAFRKRMRKHDLNTGCHMCREQLLSQNYDGVKAHFYDYHKGNKNGYPVSLEFELSNRCNLECLMCTDLFSSKIRESRDKKPPFKEPYDDEFVRQLEEFIPHIKEAKFYGGEPFLIPIYYQIWDKIVELNPNAKIVVQTNGTILNDKVKSYMDRGNFAINISIDSIRKESFERIRKGADFDLVMANMEWFREYCKEKDTFFGFAITPILENRYEIPDLVKFCNEKKIPLYFNTIILPHEHAIWKMPQNELNGLADDLEKEDFICENDVAEKNKQHYRDFVIQLRAWALTSEEEKDQYLAKLLVIRDEYIEKFLGG